MSSPDTDAVSAQTQAVIDALFAAAATGVTDAVLEWWADDGVLDDVTIARRYRGKRELKPYLDMYYAAFPDLDFSPARVLIDGPHAAVEWAETFHFVGDFDGIRADGRELRVRALDLFEIRGGLVVHESGWYGDAWLRHRLADPDPSALPPPLPRGVSWVRRAAPDPRPPTPSTETREVIDRLFAAAATGVTDAVLEWWADDGVLDDVTIARRFAGRTELEPYLEMYYRALPDLDFRPSLLLVDGPWALVEWAETCHVVAPFDGVPGDGRHLRLRAVDLFEVRDGRVVHESSWYGDGWLRDRLELSDPSRLPPELPRGESWQEHERGLRKQQPGIVDAAGVQRR
jgi:steroid delta-isomerase-like uncharacterized protein